MKGERLFIVRLPPQNATAPETESSDCTRNLCMQHHGKFYGTEVYETLMSTFDALRKNYKLELQLIDAVAGDLSVMRSKEQ